jgi:integrase/recombinase XerD
VTSLPVPSASGPPAEVGGPDALLQLVAAWLLSVRSDNTRKAYRRDLAQWAAFLAEHDVTLLAARRPHVDAWSATLRQAGRAPATIARKLASLSSFYDYALDAGAVAANPAAKATRPDIDRDHSDTRALDVDQARALLTTAAGDGPRSEAIVRLALQDGLRVAEIAAADITDLGAERGHRYLTVTRKGGRRGRIALPPPVAHAVDHAAADRAEGPIIATRTGKPMAASEIYRTIVRLANAAGITGVSPHSLRHTYATLALDAGATLREVQDDLGHRDPRTTRRYDRARERLDRSGAYKVAAALGE